MINAYTQVAANTNTSAQLNVQIFRSVLAYLQDYKNTSNSKGMRIGSLEKASQLLEHIVSDINVNIEGEESDILHAGFLKILTKVKQAILDKDSLYDFSNEIGFIKVLM